MASTLDEGLCPMEYDEGSNAETIGEDEEKEDGGEDEEKEDGLLESCASHVCSSNNEIMASIEDLSTNTQVLEPYTGMAFESVEDARVFYNVYAKHIGFTIRTNRIRHSQKNRTIIARDYVCSREGFRAEKHTLRKDRILPPRPITREGCKAMIRVAVRDGGKWVVTKFVQEHNHNLMIHNKAPDHQSKTNVLSEAEKDKKIEDLFNDLHHERQRSAAFREQLHLVLKDIEEHAEYISMRVEDIVNNMREIESEGQELSHLM